MKAPRKVKTLNKSPWDGIKERPRAVHSSLLPVTTEMIPLHHIRNPSVIHTVNLFQYDLFCWSLGLIWDAMSLSRLSMCCNCWASPHILTAPQSRRSPRTSAKRPRHAIGSLGWATTGLRDRKESTRSAEHAGSGRSPLEMKGGSHPVASAQNPRTGASGWQSLGVAKKPDTIKVANTFELQ